MFLDRVPDSPAYEIFNAVLKKANAGVDVVSLAIGEPSFDTPAPIIAAAVESMRSGGTHYISSFGTADVRMAISEKVARKNGIRAKPQNTIFMTTKLSVYASLMAVARDGYEALIPDPGYYYSEPVLMSGGKPVRYPLAKDFSLDLDAIERRLTERTRAVIVNTPGNPTGKVFDKRSLERLYLLCKERGVAIISDESYEDLVYEKTHHSLGSFEEEPEVVFSLFSLSKSYAMTGWRAGYVVAGEDRVRLMNRFIEGTVTCYPPFIEAASAYALRHGARFSAGFRRELKERRRIMEKEVARIPQLEGSRAEGAFYLFPRLKVNGTSREVCSELLERHDVAVLPGSFFGPAGEGRIRVSFGASRESIVEGMKRLRAGLAERE